jgi:acetoin utilization deacetylase AcuC-like enzyme
MTTRIYTHEACLHHDTGVHHPERPDRLRAILRRLKSGDFAALDWAEAPQATADQIAAVHSRAYVDDLLATMDHLTGLRALDPDTMVSPGSKDAALRAAGAVCAAVDAVVTGDISNAFCAVRPPGHHAEPETAMGFCLFNNVAVGALHARAAHGLKRIAVVDFDVHHGNGTEAMFAPDADLVYASTHQSPLYPGTGSAAFTGSSHNIVNVPIRPGGGGAELRAAFDAKILPAIDAFKPEMILISAGFDAHESDPLANLRFTDEDFAWATDVLLKAAGRHCAGRVVSTLEGGYDLDALASSAAAHVSALMAA